MGDKEVVALLGGRKALGVTKTTRLSLADAIRRGFPPDSLERLAETLGLNLQEMANAVGLSTKTLSRRRKHPGRPLGAVESDRLYRLAVVFARAQEVFEDDEVAREWLHTPQVGLAGRIPLDVLNTGAGAREVEDLLGRIDYGVLS
jgi:putative toxin-antitoxin system antitoxin component (TIGR02293 family)